MKPDLNEIKRIPIQKRTAGKKIQFISGSALLQSSKRFRLGVRGPEGVGKTATVLSMIQDHVIVRAEDDDWIREVFGHNENLLEEVLAAGVDKRRSYLKDAHKVIFLDFDNRGLHPLINSNQMHEALLDCIQYLPVQDWETAHAAVDLGMEVLEEHALKYGKLGFWWVVDNCRTAWSLCQSDFVRAITGVDEAQLMAEIRMQNPGQSKEARRQQAKEMAENKDWSVINSQHNDLFMQRMANTEANMFLLSPNQTREREVNVNGRVETQLIPVLGGAKDNPFICDYIFRKYKSEDGHTFFADLSKSRYTGDLGRKISNPTWTRMREEIERIEGEHRTKKIIEFNKIEFAGAEPMEVPAMPVEDPLPDIEMDLTPAVGLEALRKEPTITSDDVLDMPDISLDMIANMEESPVDIVIDLETIDNPNLPSVEEIAGNEAEENREERITELLKLNKGELKQKAKGLNVSDKGIKRDIAMRIADREMIEVELDEKIKMDEDGLQSKLEVLEEHVSASEDDELDFDIPDIPDIL